MPNRAIDEASIRLEHLKNIKQAGINPFPADSHFTHSLKEAKELPENAAVQIVGRLHAKRDMGRICFCHLKDDSERLQLVISEKEVGKETYKFFIKNIEAGDFLNVEGTTFVTKAGEKSVLMQKYQILAKTLLPLPEKFHGLTDVEIRYRKRYLDLLSNEDSMRIAKLRSAVVKEIRNFFDEKGFYEVETPVLQPLYGGANAKPFTTYHNALDIPLYLRVAPELYLKRLIVGGFEKVYEIAKCFRNEGVDNNHSPEFTQIEFYWAYADYAKLMDLMEEFLPRIIQKAGLPLKFKVGEQMVDFTPPYPRVSMRDLIKKYAKLDIEKFSTQAGLFEEAIKLKVENIDKNINRGKLIDEIYKTIVRPNIVNPIFMVDHPIELSPLAKKKEDDERYAQRMQLICVGGNELCNAFSELNDPMDQEERFKEQRKLNEAGDEEGMPYDEDFITALKHGMPPTAGLGMGIDRLVKLLADVSNLKEVILFPTLKPESG